MPHVSRIKLDKKTEVKLTKTLELILSKINKEEEMNSFLLALLTPTERVMLAKRLAVIILLKEGIPDSHIASTLHVTRITVAKMQLFLEARGAGYKIALRILENEKVLQELKGMLIKLVSYSIRTAGRSFQ